MISRKRSIRKAIESERIKMNEMESAKRINNCETVADRNKETNDNHGDCGNSSITNIVPNSISSVRNEFKSKGIGRD